MNTYCGIPTVAPANPTPGMLIYNAILHQLQVFTGTTWQHVSQLGNACVVCKKVQHIIENNMIPDHPFCADNLEFLEWKYAQTL